MNALLALAGKEFTDHLRNGWTITVAAAFAAFAAVIALAGFSFTGAITAMEPGVIILSLNSLVMYLIPLLGLLLGYGGIAGEREQGTLELLLSYPLASWQLILGKLLGLSAVLGLCIILGLALPASVDLWRGGSLLPWLLFAVNSVWIGVIFLALALWCSALFRQRAAVLGAALAAWLLWVILFDLGMLAVLVASGSSFPASLLTALFFLNPASLFRFFTLGVVLTPETANAMGYQALLPETWTLVLGLGCWTMLPVLAAMRRVRWLL